MSESPPDVDMTYSVWTHACDQPWPGTFRCQDVHLAGPVSRLAADMFVESLNGFVIPRERVEIRHGSAGHQPVWTNDITPYCAAADARETKHA